MSIANITIVGNVGGDPETRYTPSGTMNVRFSVAVNHRRTDQSGQQQDIELNDPRLAKIVKRCVWM